MGRGIGLRLSKVGWRVYDVRIEGVSYVENYHNQFAAEIDALGLTAVIDRMQTEIDDMRPATLVDLNVGRFQVAVQ